MKRASERWGRRFRLPTKLLLSATALLTAACGGGHGNIGAVAIGSGDKKPEPPKPVEYFHVDPSTAATITGAVKFTGAKPARQLISMESDEGCQKTHAGKPAYDEAVVIGKNGGLANTFVYIQAGLGGKKFEPNTEAVVMDQHGCMFVPRIIGIRPGQTLDLKNGDAVAHNVHPMPVNNREWNQEQAPQAPTVHTASPVPKS